MTQAKTPLIEAAVAFLNATLTEEKSSQQKEYEKRGHAKYEPQKDRGHTLPKGHIIKHHRDSDMADQGYVGKHPDGHSVTDISTDSGPMTHEAIHAEVKKQNPHLSPETHKVIAKAIHADVGE